MALSFPVQQTSKTSKGDSGTDPAVEWAISSSEIFIEGEPIGSGGFSTVHVGRWNGVKVAVKKLSKGASRQVLTQEVMIWRRLQHPHIAQFFRASIDSDPALLISQFYQFGNVVDYLFMFPDANRIKICYDISLGMHFLHNEKVLHGDLKPANVLMDDAHSARIADFGLSRIKSLQTTRTTANDSIDPMPTPPGTRVYMSPQRLRGGRLKNETDAYAFGMSMYQIMTDDVPFNRPLTEQDLWYLVVENRERPERPEEDEFVERGLTDAVWELMEKCWQHEGKERPTFTILSKSLDPLQRTWAFANPIQSSSSLLSVTSSDSEQPLLTEMYSAGEVLYTVLSSQKRESDKTSHNIEDIVKEPHWIPALNHGVGDNRTRLARLPPSQEMYATESGRIYFVDHADEKTTWRDTYKVGQVEEVLTFVLGPLPSGWKLKHDKKGSIFFMNDGTRRLTWDDPRLSNSKLVKVDKPLLTSFHRFSSAAPSESPVDWLRENRAQFQQVLERNLVHKSRRTSKVSIDGVVLYQRLIAFLQRSRPKAISELRDDLAMWKTWDTLTTLSQHSAIGKRLGQICVNMDALEELQAIIALDVDAICVELHVICMDEEHFKILLGLRDQRAQGLLNLLQMLLDLPSLDRTFRSLFLKALLRLSKDSGQYPESLVRQDAVLEGGAPFEGGSFGEVWRGLCNGRLVAVKVLRLYQKTELQKHFKNVIQETLIWRQLRHANVLPFIGIHHVNGNLSRIALVSPWMANGHLQAFLRRNPTANRLPLVLDVAEGLDYLHTMEPTIVHGDLKAVNILISEAGRACLADFGLSTVSNSQLPSLATSTTRVGGTLRWTAPEIFEGSQPRNDVRSDMYAFACVSYEIFSGNIPFHNIANDSTVLRKVIEGERPLRPSVFAPTNVDCLAIGLDDEIWAVTVEDCWKPFPDERLRAQEVIERLLPKVQVSRPVNREHSQAVEPTSWLHFVGLDKVSLGKPAGKRGLAGVMSRLRGLKLSSKLKFPNTASKVS